MDPGNAEPLTAGKVLRGIGFFVGLFLLLVLIGLGIVCLFWTLFIYASQLAFTHTIQPDSMQNRRALIFGIAAVVSLTILAYTTYRKTYGSQWFLFEIHMALEILIPCLIGGGALLGLVGVTLSFLTIIFESSEPQYIPLILWGMLTLVSFTLLNNLKRLKLPFEPP